MVSLTVVTLISTITETGMFWLYGAFSLPGLLCLRRWLPETKARSLEDVDRELQERAT